MIIFTQTSSDHSNSHKADPQSRYNRDLENCQVHRMKCPCCGTVGKMKKHSTYSRFIHMDKDSDPVLIVVTVFRCSCKTCQHPNHAFLPRWICPFCLLTYPFLASVLGFFYGDGSQQILTTAKMFNLSRSTVRRLIEHYGKEEWAVLQTDLAKQEAFDAKKAALRISRSLDDLKQFVIDFLHIHSKSFFTRHFPLESFWSFLCYGMLD